MLLPCWRGPCRSAGRSRGFRRGSRAGKPRSSTAAAGAARHGVAGAACPHHRLGSAPTLPLGPHTLAAPGVVCPRCRWGRMSLPPLGHEPTMQLEPYTCATAGAACPRRRWGFTAAGAAYMCRRWDPHDLSATGAVSPRRRWDREPLLPFGSRARLYRRWGLTTTLPLGSHTSLPLERQARRPQLLCY